MSQAFYSISISKLLFALATSCLLLMSGCGEEDVSQDGEVDIGNTVDIDGHKTRAQIQIDRGQFRAALIEARNIIQKRPSDSEGYVLVAKVYNTLGQARSAINILENEAIVDKDSGYWITLAHAHYLRGKYKSSADLLDAHPEAAITYGQQYALLRAKNAFRLGRVEQAKDTINQLIKDSKDDAKNNIEARLELVKIELVDNLPEGRRRLEQLLVDAPNNPEVLLLESRDAYNQGELDRAEDILNKILSILPSTDLMTPMRIEILNTLSELLVKQGRSNEALVYTRILSEAFPGANEIKSKYEQAITEYKEGRLDESAAILSALLEEAPNYETARQLLSVIKYLQGDFEASAAQFSDNNLDPETASPAAKHAFALSSLRLNKPQEVLDVLSVDIDSTNNPDTLSLYGAAVLLSSSEDSQKGIDALRKALSLDNKRTRIHLLLANYYNRQLPPEYEEALAELKQAYAVTPEDVAIQKGLVQQQLAMKDIKKATATVKDILDNQPSEVTSQLLAGDFYLAQQQYKKSQAYYVKALEIENTVVDGFIGIIRTAIRLEQWQQAEQTALDLIKQFPEQTIGYTALSSVYQAQGTPEKIFDELTHMVEKDDNAAAAALLASNYGRNGDFAKARQYQETAVSLAPDNEVFKGLNVLITIQEASRYLSEKDYVKARETALAGLNQSPDNERLITVLTLAEIFSENYSEAEKIIQQIMPNNAYLANLLNGDLSRARELYERALDYYNRAWEIQPNDQVGLKIFTVLRSQKENQRANDFLVTWLDKFPDSISALVISSDIQLAEGNHQEAIEILEKIIAARPRLVASLNNLAWAYSKVDNPKAEATAKRAYELAPDNGAVADTYGWILYNEGKEEEAIAVLKKATELLPDNKEIQQHLDIALGNRKPES